MAAQVSKQLMEAMGFKEISDDLKIVARFYSLHIYEIQGVTLPEQLLPVYASSVLGRNFRLAMGTSLNKISQTLTDSDFTDDEGKWREEHKCSPPYLVVQFGPTDEYSFAGLHYQDIDDAVCTYQGFATAKVVLSEWSNEVLPHLITGLVASFFEQDSVVKFLSVDREVYGKTSEGKTVNDVRLDVSGTLVGLRSLTEATAASNIAKALEIAKNSNPKVVKFFQLAHEEKDALKKFLYFFLTIEIVTHKTYEKIDHTRNISILIPPPSRVAESTQKFFEAQREQWRSLADRFMWCVLCSWTQLSDSDVQEFKRLKQIRDSIAHGNIETPPPDSVQSVEKLAIKLLQSPKP